MANIDEELSKSSRPGWIAEQCWHDLAWWGLARAKPVWFIRIIPDPFGGVPRGLDQVVRRTQHQCLCDHLTYSTTQRESLPRRSLLIPQQLIVKMLLSYDTWKGTWTGRIILDFQCAFWMLKVEWVGSES